jgi:hypothetical protein
MNGDVINAGPEMEPKQEVAETRLTVTLTPGEIKEVIRVAEFRAKLVHALRQQGYAS